MPNQNTDRDDTWIINTDDDTWTLAKNATIITDAEPGVFVGNEFNGNTINLLGDVVTTGFAQVAVQIQGDYNNLNIGEDSHIDGSAVNVGVDINGLQARIVNKGLIEGINSGVSGYIETTLINAEGGTVAGGWAVYSQFDDFAVRNRGTIDGEAYGIRAEGDNADLINFKNGVVKADEAVAFFDSEDGSLTNYGKIVGDVSAGNGETSIVNEGIIKGDISLGAGADFVDTRIGKVTGDISGGDGGDTFLVSSMSTSIVELGEGTGMDKVRSTVSYTLGDNLENLDLLGKKNLNGNGNDASNGLQGNKGDNVLRGFGGEDYLAGGRGNDVLFGGQAEDIFAFDLKTGNDTIRDFENGEDLIMSDFVKSDQDFADLMQNHLKVQGDDLLIEYGNDTLLIKNMEKADLDASDFFMGL